MRRSLKIEKFRNIGIDKEDEIVLNTSVEKEKIGNLLILVGENGSGKSNVLAALKAFNGSISDRDVTNLEFDDEYQRPAVSLVTEHRGEKYVCKREYGCKNYQVKSNADQKKWITREIAIDVCQKAARFGMQMICQKYSIEILHILKNENSSKQELEAAYDSLRSYLNEYSQKRGYYDYNHNQWYNKINNDYPDLMQKAQSNPIKDFQNRYEEKIGIPAIPNVIEYSDQQINDNDLRCSPTSINAFVDTVLDNIGYKKENIQNAYKKFNQQSNRNILSKLETELNKNLAKISKDFNSIYFSSEEEYKFEFSVDPDQIFFTIAKNNVPLTLNYQSVGFRWFFDLYFNQLMKKSLNIGDILLMDEPANCLHAHGMQELRKFIKEYAIKSGITIVIATNSPFLIDVDNLDELKLVKNASGKSTIENDFSSICPNNPDTLSNICNALTIKHHILCDPDKQLIFVEGITDYNYLTCFKKVLGDKYDNLAFIPVGGLGDRKASDFADKQRCLLNEIKRISKRSDAFLLVDGDKAGESIKKLNGDNKDIKVISIKEVNQEFKEIELMFAESDRSNFGIQRKDGKFVKSSALSSNMKKYSKANDFSEETKNNFKNLFDKLLEENM